MNREYKSSIVLSALFLCVLNSHGFTVRANQMVQCTITVRDHKSGNTVPARVLLRSKDGTCWCPDSAVSLKIGPDVWFMSTGKSTVKVPAGRLELRVERGKEYNRIRQFIDVPSRQQFSHDVTMQRWIHMAERGYKSGENHVHRSPEDVGVLCAAEDLQFGSVMQWWNGVQYDIPKKNGNVRQMQVAGTFIPVTLYDVEVEHAWGALYMIGLDGPFPFPNLPEECNLSAAQFGRTHGALNCYQGGYSPEVLIDALLGYVDVVNVCNNNFHMHRFQPRSFYSNLLGVEGFPVYPDTPEGMMLLNMESYYRLLNMGFRLAAGAGSAIGAKEVPIGYNRSYVQCEPSDGITEFLANWRKGRNFVTNGSMLFFKINEDYYPGDAIALKKSGQLLPYEIEVLSDSPLTGVELIWNGAVVKKWPVSDARKSLKVKGALNIAESGWICARCTDRDDLLTDEELATYAAPPSQYTQQPSRLRFAHTSPVYVTVDGKPCLQEDALQDGITMIEAFRKFARTHSDDAHLPLILNIVDQAQDKLLKMAKSEEI